MRDCKTLMGLPKLCGAKGPSISSQILRDVIRREVATATTRAELAARVSLMYTNLDQAFGRDELTGRSYLCLKGFLRELYEDRRAELFKKEGALNG